MDLSTPTQVIDGWRIGWAMDGHLMSPSRGPGTDGLGLTHQLTRVAPNRIGQPGRDFAVPDGQPRRGMPSPAADRFPDARS